MIQPSIQKSGCSHSRATVDKDGLDAIEKYQPKKSEKSVNEGRC
jgi:hypothetical protein